MDLVWVVFDFPLSEEIGHANKDRSVLFVKVLEKVLGFGHGQVFQDIAQDDEVVGVGREFECQDILNKHAAIEVGQVVFSDERFKNFYGIHSVATFGKEMGEFAATRADIQNGDGGREQVADKQPDIIIEDVITRRHYFLQHLSALFRARMHEQGLLAQDMICFILRMMGDDFMSRVCYDTAFRDIQRRAGWAGP